MRTNRSTRSRSTASATAAPASTTEGQPRQVTSGGTAGCRDVYGRLCIESTACGCAKVAPTRLRANPLGRGLDMATARRPEPEVTAGPIVRPVMRDGRPFCPRCGSGLQLDYEGLTCIACGYEFAAPANEPEWRRLLDRRRAAALWPLLVGARLNPYLVAAGLVILAFPAVVAWARRLRARRGSSVGAGLER